jgi:hypothetical protein
VRWLAVLVVAVALAGCGGSSAPSSSTTSTVSRISVTSSIAATSSSISTTVHSSTRSTFATSQKASAVGTAPPPTPAGTPAAPGGLARTSGYAMYENCSSHCSGAVPSALRRPLHLPSASASCPVHAQAGPVSLSGSLSVRVSTFLGSSWDGTEVTWTGKPGFRGAILIRGRQLGGGGAVGFGEGRTPYDELQLYATGKNSWPSFTRVRAAGCYALQIDTAHASDVIVFRAAK